MGNSIKVILKKDIPNLGEEGDVEIVKVGYARNYLFPNGLALDYSLKNRNILKRQTDAIAKKKLEKKENSLLLKQKLEETKVSIEINAGEKGRLYGTVTTSHIFDELTKLDFPIDKKKIDLKEHIKFAGLYKFTVHIYQDIYAEVALEVIAKQEEKKEDNRRPKRKKRYDRHDNFDFGDKKEENKNKKEHNQKEGNKIEKEHNQKEQNKDDVTKS